MTRLFILAAVVLTLGGCVRTVQGWMAQEYVQGQVARCHANPNSDPQLCAQIAPEATP